MKTPNIYEGLKNIYGEPISPPKSNHKDSRRKFTKTQEKYIIYQQNSKCAVCHKQLDPRDIEFDHQKSWADGGRTITENGRAVCGSCHNIITHEQRRKNLDKKRKPQEDMFGFNIPRKSNKTPFGF
ncbi:MAG: HNH endonuclease [Candidatus Aenigmarchaeota archaeon]|nr:HNH endonuclease [Candidatus Aenigmarchaeota archaeon]